jgi:hypothetical protein
MRSHQKERVLPYRVYDHTEAQTESQPAAEVHTQTHQVEEHHEEEHHEEEDHHRGRPLWALLVILLIIGIILAALLLPDDPERSTRSFVSTATPTRQAAVIGTPTATRTGLTATPTTTPFGTATPVPSTATPTSTPPTPAPTQAAPRPSLSVTEVGRDPIEIGQRVYLVASTSCPTPNFIWTGTSTDEGANATAVVSPTQPRSGTVFVRCGPDSSDPSNQVSWSAVFDPSQRFPTAVPGTTVPQPPATSVSPRIELDYEVTLKAQKDTDTQYVWLQAVTNCPGARFEWTEVTQVDLEDGSQAMVELPYGTSRGGTLVVTCQWGTLGTIWTVESGTGH